MTQRSLLIASLAVAAIIVVVGCFWLAGRDDGAAISDRSDQSLASPSGNSVQSTNMASQSLDAGDDSRAAADSNESIETLMREIEQNAGGDDTAMEDELVGESESFTEGAVVMEQLGQSYDETKY
ncbi:MAG: hypothetical protein WBB68_03670 [Candidatus Moraniibacteriota bacterium]